MNDSNLESSKHFTLILVMFILLVIVGAYYQNPMTIPYQSHYGYYGPSFYGYGYYGSPYVNPYAYSQPMSIGNSMTPNFGYWW